MFMKIECMPCFIKQVLNELDGSDLTDEQREMMMRKMLHLLSEVDYDHAPVEISEIMHREMVKSGAAIDPYMDQKRYSTRRALIDAVEIEEEINSSSDPLLDSAYAAIAGNVIDYGAKNMLDLHDVLSRARENGFILNDWDLFLEELSKANKLYYLLDNSGEVVFDKLFMKEILDASPSLKILPVVKRIPLLNDVTREDAKEAGLVDDDRIEIIEVPGEGWITPDDINDLREEGAVFLSKGQGNYESLSDAGGTFFLLVAKCELVAGNLGVEVGDMVFKYI